ADEVAGRFLLDGEEAEAHHVPHPRMPHEAAPALLAVERPAADETDHVRIGPHVDIGVEVVERVGPEPQPLRLEGRNHGSEPSAAAPAGARSAGRSPPPRLRPGTPPARPADRARPPAPGTAPPARRRCRAPPSG